MTETTQHDELLVATRLGERWVKIGVLSLLLLPAVKLLEVGCWLTQQQLPLDDDTSGFVLGSFVLGAWLTTLIVLPYQYLFFVVELIASVVHRILGGNSTREEWLTMTYRALWPFPYAAWAGVIVGLLVYYVAEGHFLFTLLLVIVGQLLGAWCYLSIFAAWYHARQNATPSKDRSNHSPRGRAS